MGLPEIEWTLSLLKSITEVEEEQKYKSTPTTSDFMFRNMKVSKNGINYERTNFDVRLKLPAPVI